ncbi:hypothetical protein HMPREF0293_2106 [Corynebacterium glucuronolyticum ATCC 51866]|uniref:Uncharacterized protein n=1 Tax=Corynebacterium glucuronolyticum ATCC 51866 TaxID=548478 RepID=A0ABM9XMK2_9CORY|nr:hypothetical protein HMPREF0293_2106 [Corynebacterium glucuronolyticum ATCC 51866]
MWGGFRAVVAHIVLQRYAGYREGEAGLLRGDTTEKALDRGGRALTYT